MGIGKHPDHIIVYDTVMNYQMNKQLKVILYPEYPYARCKKAYIERMEEINKNYTLKPIIVDIKEKIDILADASIAYRSQFDDINRNQMLAIIREDARAIAQEYLQDNESLIYYEIGDKK
ncbi:MAG: hypothetical protein IJ777_01895 [Clostridia bacterium]|nr:hypothetical protein [Clostridia bacterium]